MFKELNIYRKISIIIYNIVLFINIVFAFLYLFRTKFMPYHSQALNISWDNLAENYRVLILALMRAAGGGMLSCAVSVGILLYIPLLQKKQIWANFAILITSYCLLILSLIATIYVKIMTDFASVIIYYQKRGSYYGGNKTGCYSFHRII